MYKHHIKTWSIHAPIHVKKTLCFNGQLLNTLQCTYPDFSILCTFYIYNKQVQIMHTRNGKVVVYVYTSVEERLKFWSKSLVLIVSGLELMTTIWECGMGKNRSVCTYSLTYKNHTSLSCVQGGHERKKTGGEQIHKFYHGCCFIIKAIKARCFWDKRDVHAPWRVHCWWRCQHSGHWFGQTQPPWTPHQLSPSPPPSAVEACII